MWKILLCFTGLHCTLSHIIKWSYKIKTWQGLTTERVRAFRVQESNAKKDSSYKGLIVNDVSVISTHKKDNSFPRHVRISGSLAGHAFLSPLQSKFNVVLLVIGHISKRKNPVCKIVHDTQVKLININNLPFYQ